MVSPSFVSKVKNEHLERKAFVYIRESTPGAMRQHLAGAARQYSMKERALALGWPSDNIQIIDKDRGITGASTFGRDGFKEMLSEIIIGNVGAVFCSEFARLTRDSNDSQFLIKSCALSETLIIDEYGIYDLTTDDDCLMLGMKGTAFAIERRFIRARMLGAKELKARNGDLRMILPVGFVYNLDRKIVLDPDEEVQSAVRLVFQLFDELGSAGAVIRYFNKNSLLFPTREGGGHDGNINWGSLTRSRLMTILYNPAYAGAFTYGRTKAHTRLISPTSLETKRVQLRSKFEDWKVLIPDHHDGYITWAQYQNIQKRLSENGYHFTKGLKGAPRTGSALLQGTALCGKCGRHMYVFYPSNESTGKTPYYICHHRKINLGLDPCQSILSTVIDRAVSQQILKAIEPAQLEISLGAWQQLEGQSKQIDQQWRLRLERADYEASLARRRFMQVDPENRRVARQLEQEWNEKLNEIERLKYEHAEAKKRMCVSVSAEERKLILGLATDFPKIWYADTTTHDERKKLLRYLVDDVTLTRVNSTVHINIRWRTQALTTLTARLTDYSEVINLIRELAHDYTDRQIAEHLNEMGLLNKKGMPFHRGNITAFRTRYKIKLESSEHHGDYPDGQRKDGLFTTRKAAQLLGFSHATVQEWMKIGLIDYITIGAFRWILLTPEKIIELRNIKGKRKLQAQISKRHLLNSQARGS
jgi:DNA invertase Pin-like site-specific DNA recombinase